MISRDTFIIKKMKFILNNNYVFDNIHIIIHSMGSTLSCNRHITDQNTSIPDPVPKLVLYDQQQNQHEIIVFLESRSFECVKSTIDSMTFCRTFNNVKLIINIYKKCIQIYYNDLFIESEDRSLANNILCNMINNKYIKFLEHCTQNNIVLFADFINHLKNNGYTQKYINHDLAHIGNTNVYIGNVNVCINKNDIIWLFHKKFMMYKNINFHITICMISPRIHPSIPKIFYECELVTHIIITSPELKTAKNRFDTEMDNIILPKFTLKDFDIKLEHSIIQCKTYVDEYIKKYIDSSYQAD